MARRVWARRLVWVLVVVAVLYGIDRWLLSSYGVSTSLMAPAVDGGDRVLVARAYYDFADPARGDLVLLHPNGIGNRALFARSVSTSERVRRVVGMPGEWIRARYGKVQLCTHGNVGCQTLKEPYAHGAQASFGPIHVPPGRYFVLCDQRPCFDDSRTWGSIARSQIVGRVVAVVWPPLRVRVF